ncbi:MAG: hypothetical protein V3S48_07385 [Candidatus Neomarinimicrobiota bacterium]
MKMVIGQQVKSVYPQSVDLITKVINDIMKYGEIDNGTVEMENHGFKVGDRLYVIYESNGIETITEILTVTKNTFDIKSNNTGKIYVVGHEVNDFHVVDYDAIAMLSVSALQELGRIIKNIQIQNDNLLVRIEAMEKSIEIKDTY